MGNEDLIGEALDAEQLATELREANAKIEQLVQMHRQYTELFAMIARAAGVQLTGSLERVVDTVIERLRIVELVAPEPAPAPTGALICETCGKPGAVEFDGEPLCSNCSGANAIAEARQMLRP
jgi:hypothetical protein